MGHGIRHTDRVQDLLRQPSPEGPPPLLQGPLLPCLRASGEEEMTRFDFIYLGELDLTGSPVSFFGDVYVYYNTVDEWLMKEFKGILKVNEDRYRGRWTQGPQFEELKRLFMADPRMVELAQEMIRRRLNIFEEKTDG
jgi:hypothetical protein